QCLRAPHDLDRPHRGLLQGHGARAARHRVILRAAVVAVYAFLLVPMLVVVVAAFNSGAFFTFPPQGLSRCWFATSSARRELMQALRLSAELAAWTAVLSTLAGTLAAIALVRGRFRGRSAVNAFVPSPLLLPQILTGVALLQFFTLLRLHQTWWALLIGHVVVPTPSARRTFTPTP